MPKLNRYVLRIPDYSPAAERGPARHDRDYHPAWSFYGRDRFNLLHAIAEEIWSRIEQRR